ncbi:MAG: CHASE domain-containing protein, partial [Limisphaerales bacterium]
MKEAEVKKSQSHRSGLALVVLTVGILLTIAATYFVSQNLQLRAEQEFRTQVLETESAITGRIDQYIALLRGASGLYAVNAWVDAHEFELFVRRLRVAEFYPGVQGLGIALLVMPDNREELLSRIRESFPDYKIRPEENVPEAFPIVFLEPMDERNRFALGYDMFSEPIRRRAMMRARETGLPAATAKVTLVQEIEGPKQPGFLIYLPIYSTGTVPETVEERSRAIEGYVYSPFRAHDFLRLIAELEWVLGFQVYDGTGVAEENLLFDSAALNGDHQYQSASLEEVRTFDVAGQPWTVRYYSQLTPLTNARWVNLIPIAGIALSFVLFYLTSAQAKAQRAAEEANRILQQSQADLRASEELHRTVMATASDGIVVSDGSGRIQSANHAAVRTLGYEEPELQGKLLSEIILPPDPERQGKGLSQFIGTGAQRGESGPLQVYGVRKNGSAVPLEISYGSFSRNTEQFVTGIFRDISDRKRQEDRVKFLVSAGKALSESLDIKETLGKIAQLAVSTIADRCQVALLDEHHHLERLPVAIAKEVQESALSSHEVPMELLVRVVREGIPHFETTSDQSEGSGSVIIVPLRGRARIYGTITFAIDSEDRVYTQNDLRTAEELAQRV